MTQITEIKDQINTKTFKLLLLNVATAGIYQIIWLNEKYKILDDITKTKTASKSYIIWIAACFGYSCVFSLIPPISSILLVATHVLNTIWSFRAKKAIQEYALTNFKIDFKMNNFYLIVFHIYYINYCINDLPEEYRKNQIITGRIVDNQVPKVN